MTNAKRLNELAMLPKSAPKYLLGQVVVEPYGASGRIDAIYADLQSALDSFVIKPGWYEQLEKKPKAPKTGIWYGVILLDGSVIAGEDDLTVLQ